LNKKDRVIAELTVHWRYCHRNETSSFPCIVALHISTT